MNDGYCSGALPLIRAASFPPNHRKSAILRIARIDLSRRRRENPEPAELAGRKSSNVPVAYGVAVEQLLEQPVTAPLTGAYSCLPIRSGLQATNALRVNFERVNSRMRDSFRYA